MASIHRSLWSCLLLLAILGSFASAQLVPSGDTYVTGASPTTANGSSTSLVVQGSSVGKPSLSYIRFDMTPLTGINASQVQSAYLRVYVTAVTAAGGFNVLEVSTPSGWAEATLTFNTAGASSPTGTQLGSTITVPYPSGKSMYFDIDVTQALKDWLSGAKANNGIVLVPNDASISVSFSSKEDTTFSQVPTINAILTPNAGSIGPSQLAAGTYAINVSGYANTLFATTQCLGGAYATGISTTGTAQCQTNGSAFTNLTPGNISVGTAGINITGNANTATSANTAGFATSAGSAATFTGMLAGDVTGIQSATVVSKIGGVPASSFARLDIGNLFNGNQSVSGGKLMFAPSAAGYPSLNVPNGSTAPTSPVTGDIWLLNTDPHLNFRDMNGISQMLAFKSDVTSANASTLSTAESFATNAANNAQSTAETFATNAANTAQSNAETFATGAANTAQANAETFATSAATTALNSAEAFSSNASNITSGTIGQGFLPNDVVYNNQGNTYSGGKQVLAGSVSSYASLNVPNGSAAPSSPVTGDIWLLSTDPHLNFRDMNGISQMLAFSTDVTSANASTLTTAESFATNAANNAQSTAETFATNAANTAQSNAETFATGAANTAQANAETFATSAATTALNSAEAFSSNASNITSGTIGQGFLPNDVVYNNQGNTYSGGKQVLAQSVAGYASLNIPINGAAPSSPANGDIWTISADRHLQFQTMTGLESLAFNSDVTSANASTLTTAESFATNAANNAQSTAETFATNAANTAQSNAETFATGAANTAQANAETFATSAATTALNSAEAFSSNASNITSGTIGQGFLPNDVVYNNQGNTFTGGKQVLAGSVSSYASLNVPNGSAAPSSPVTG